MAEIIVGYDGSEHSKKALAQAVSMAGHDDRLTVVHAYYLVGEEFGVPITEKSKKTVFANADKQLEEAKCLVPDKFASRVHYELREGKPYNVLLQVAERLSAEMIVIGSRGVNPAQGAVGSQALRLVNDAPCPVLVVH